MGYMKLISIKVSEKAYSEFKDYAAHRGRPVAEVVREAMDFYIDRQIRSARKMRRLPTTSKPKLKRRWTKEEIHEEMLG